ncbi:Rab-like protein 2A [Echinococcus granulosus]|uniref:Rab-like protein 2A n=1 Tax=Echinococcus granulosus TaxID=6210 RepID=W6UQM7_ECHGR|nr:Rab-like protein 2A [Echinococcus granulosus]EUB63995.1 Rab-like protein 2A [Echinococcus granulosus]
MINLEFKKSPCKPSQSNQLSTYALNIYKHQMTIEDRLIDVDFWDTAGQERFQSMHPSYYHQAHACILVFDVTRKITYKNLNNWLSELRKYRPEIPCFCAANKIDTDTEVTNKAFNFAKKNSIPFYFVSAANGTNVVRVFTDAVRAAVAYKEDSTDPLDQIMEELEVMEQNHEVNDGESSYADPLS